MLSINAFSQIAEVDFESRVTQSQLIIEGEVISKRSFWDNQKHNIYTANEVKVYKVFKGTLTATKIEIITPGGTVGFQKDVVQPSLNLSVNDMGVFMLENNTIDIENSKGMLQFRPYASVQGFIKYDLNIRNASGVFEKFNTIENDLYSSITNITKTKYAEIKSFTSNNKSGVVNKLAASITNFSPTTATAGTATTITIDGSGFGISVGTVRFSNADDGGATFKDGLATEIISWNDTQIVVEVYQDAGTGPIQVVGTSTVTSAQSLTVSYAQLNAEYDPGSGLETYQTRHVDRNGNGGYVWQMFTDFDANSAANSAFIRSLETWRCNSGVNWAIGAVTTTDVVANDNINIVRHDNGTELPAGTLGRCTSRWSGCAGATVEWYVEELDIVFNDGFTWNYSTGAPSITEYDFESVSVHELGHGHQLGHVIDTNDVMHYSISNGEENRDLSANNLAGAVDVQSRSTGGAVCGTTVMISAFEDASFSYGSATYTTSDSNPTPTITGDSGGAFTSSPAGLSINGSSGLITVATCALQAYTVTYTTGGVCPVSTDFAVEITAPLGIETAILSEALQVYPNPNVGAFTLLYNGKDPLKSLNVFDVTGKHILEIDLINFNDSQVINLTALAKGMYFIAIQTDAAKVTKKMIIE